MEGAPLLARRPGRGGRTAEQARAAAAGRRRAGSRRQSRRELMPVAGGHPGQIGRRVSVFIPRRPRAFARPHPSQSSRSSESFLLGEPREAPARGTTTPPRPAPRQPSRTAGGGQRALPPFWVKLWPQLWVPDLASARASPLRRVGKWRLRVRNPGLVSTPGSPAARASPAAAAGPRGRPAVTSAAAGVEAPSATAASNLPSADRGGGGGAEANESGRGGSRRACET